MLSFKNKLQKSIQDRNSNLCVGIDIDKSHFSSDVSLQQLKDHSLKIVEATTQAGFQKNSFIYDFLSSMRQKMNDPLGVRAKKRKEISQR